MKAILVISDFRVEVPNFGPITVDICYGGAFYAIVPAKALDLDLKTASASQLITAATAVKGSLNN